MDEIFGLSMSSLMVAVLVMLGLIATVIGYLALRHPLFFRLGLRNIPRRRAQTLLIVFGLMLSTLIISSAFTTGDTLSNSLRSEAIDISGAVDHLVQYETTPGRNVSEADAVVPQRVAQDLQAAFADDDRIVGFIRALFDTVSISNVDTGQRLALSFLLGLDPAEVEAIGGIPAPDGSRISLDDFAEGSIILNTSAATQLAAQPGHQILVRARGVEHAFTVVALAQDTLVSGQVNPIDPQGGVIRLEAAQAIFNQPDVMDGVGVTVTGGVTGALALSDEIDTALNQFLVAQAAAEVANNVPPSARVYADALGRPIFESAPFKQENVDNAELFGSIFTSLFLLMGLFSIAAGILLIFLIFVLLAEERKPEMGIARAIGMRRSHLVQTYLAEGMAYNVGSAVVGTALGIIVAFLMVIVLNAAFDDSLGFTFTRHVEPRSVVVSAGMGIILTFVTVAVSASRVSVLNIVAAIRDIPEGALRERRPFSFLGLLTTPIGLALLWLTIVTLPIGLLLRLAVPSRTRERLGAWLYIPFWQLMRWRAEWWATLTVLGLFLAFSGGGSGSGFIYLTGLTLLPMGLLLTARRFGGTRGLPTTGRFAHTIASAAVLFFWLAGAWFHADVLGADVEGGPELFFLSGAAMVTAGVIIVIVNLGVFVSVLRLVGLVFGRLRPVVQTAVAYPGTAPFRTGMTIAMIAIIMFALVTFTTINSNFARLFTSDTAAGGYQIQADADRDSAIDDLPAALNNAGAGNLADGLQGISRLLVGSTNGTDIVNLEAQAFDGFRETLILADDGQPIIEPAQDTEFRQLFVAGADDAFLDENGVVLQARAFGFATDAAVWQALRDPAPDGRRYAVITANAVEGSGGFAPIEDEDFKLPDSIDEDTQRIPQITVQLSNSDRDAKAEVIIIGVIDQVVGIAAAAPGDLRPTLITNVDVVAALYESPDLVRHLARATPGFDALETAQAIEAALQLETVSIIDELKDQQDTFNAIIGLFQGFTAMGLVAGLAALGVLAVRAVVERRQQIGVLRAIGFRASWVRLGLMLEMGFISGVGLLLGGGLALVLSWRLFDEGAFGSTSGAGFYVPIGRIALFFGIAIVATVILTYLPARQASTKTVAESLRYE
ncbi:MAG: putative ABC transport system permease protein [Chloroflexi bacterium]|nr:MAG: putative ABC transport system permease protein [Chloroflexota bacterium]